LPTFAKVAQADGAYERLPPRRTIDWRKFDSGADVITAVASGDIQIGYVGSSPLAAAASRELPIETIFIAADRHRRSARRARWRQYHQGVPTWPARRSPCPLSRPRTTACWPR
jgi:ABC-type taurine transport system substrate-binding protein